MFLIDDDCHAQVFDGVGFGLGVAWQEVADERAESVIQLAAGFSGNGIENDRGLAGPGYPGEDRDFAFGNTQRDILQVVFAGTTYSYIFLGHNPLLLPIIDHSTTSLAQPEIDQTSALLKSSLRT